MAARKQKARGKRGRKEGEMGQNLYITFKGVPSSDLLSPLRLYLLKFLLPSSNITD
jgi:hypothetical protein